MTCKKCGGTSVAGPTFSMGGIDCSCKPMQPWQSEHLEWSCRRCGFTWPAPTKEQEQVKDASMEAFIRAQKT